jgi:hypothetical protein
LVFDSLHITLSVYGLRPFLFFAVTALSVTETIIAPTTPLIAVTLPETAGKTQKLAGLDENTCIHIY